MRHRAAVVAVAFSLAGAAAGAGSAWAQEVAAIVVVPGAADPGGVVRVSNGPAAPCPPPGGTSSPSASVDLFAAGSATPVNRAPYQGAVSAVGTWSVEVRLAPDVPPGTYRVQAGCYGDSGLNSGYKLDYVPGRLDIRLQDPGRPTSSTRRGGPGDAIQVSSGEARCPPPPGALSPRVRVSLLDSSRATRAEGEGPVDPATGRWQVGLRVPDLPAQNAEVTAVCLARVGAPSPYARYQAAPFAVEVDLPRSPAPTAAPPTAPPVTAVAPGPTPSPTRSPTNIPAGALPPTPLAVPIVAEPTYTG